MICRICGEDIDEKGQDNISPISGYPVCEDCKDEICCAECFNYSDLYFDSQSKKILCRDCLLEKAEERGDIHTGTIYYDCDWSKLCDDCDLDKVIEYLKDTYNVQEVPQ